MDRYIKIHFCFVLIIVFYMLSCCRILATTLDEDIKLQSELQVICNYHKNPCKIQLSPSNLTQGYTTYKGEIVLTQGLRTVLTYNEAKAVGLHEIGHHILQHHNRQYIFLTTHTNPTKQELKDFRHKNELQADAFATYYYLLKNEYNYLPEALKKLTSKDKLHQETLTHPSTYRRVQIMDKLQRSYKRSSTNFTRMLNKIDSLK